MDGGDDGLGGWMGAGGDQMGSCGFKAVNGKNDTTAERGDATFLVLSFPTTSCLTPQGFYHL